MPLADLKSAASSRFHLPEFATSVLGKPPVWRNGRRTGLKNVKPAVSRRFF
jgi:hypothetical protein